MVYFNAFNEASSHLEESPDHVDVPEKAAKVAVLMKEGYEEGETFSIVDIMRRLGAECTTFYFDETPWVRGMHGMMIQADEKFGDKIEEYDAVVLPGGRPGGPNLIADQDLMAMLKRWDKTPGKILSALCFGTRALAAAGVIEGKHMTGYTGYDQFLTGAIFETKVAVADQNLVSSQGPATGYPFAFKLAEALGYDTRIVRSRLMYDYAGGILG
ncbi:MAG: DJ-1/PfpI family protein [Firmicutes bacterium]|nr:DJ-1/PfpI family protein [Bacillota bacterium]